jgi:hypothetical protein
MNYNNNQTQIDLSYDQMNNMMNNNTMNNNYLNNYGSLDSSVLTPNNLAGGIVTQPILFGNMSNDNLINMANNIDPNSLNGTLLDDNEMSKMYSQKNKTDDNKSLIKSLTKEIINNLKENNMSLYDNSSINSRSKKNYDDNYNDNDNDNDNETDDYLNEQESLHSHSHSSKSINSSNSSKKSKKNKKNKELLNLKETIEDFVVNNETPNPIGYVQWFFDDCFNYKDFFILFILYFLLSQEMIKDFFARYFSSLNPDDEGKIGVQGVIIYGLILTILFMIIKKLF